MLEHQEQKDHHQSYPDILIVVGNPRSGTTFLANAIRNTLDLGIPREEAKFVVPLYRKLKSFGDLEDPANLRRLIRAILSTQVFVFMRRVESIPVTEEEILDRIQKPTYTDVLYAIFQLVADKKGNSRLGYKNPIDVMHMPLLLELMPTARFVHIIRDGRDASISLTRLSWGPNNLYAGARDWQRIVSKGRSDGRSMPGRYFELRMEDLVTDTANVSAKLGDFITGGQDAQRVADFVKWVNEKKDADKINLWEKKLSRKQRYICEMAAGRMLRACGYPTEFSENLKPSFIKSLYYMGSDFSLRVKNRLRREPKYWEQ